MNTATPSSVGVLHANGEDSRPAPHQIRDHVAVREGRAFGGPVPLLGARPDRRAIGISVLAGVALFADLPERDLADLAQRTFRRQYDRGQVIFTQGDHGTSLCIIESGQVNIVVITADGHELLLNRLGPGEVFGELALLDDQPRSAGAVAQAPCQLIHLRREDFVGFVDERPRVAWRLLVSISRRLRRTTQQAQDLAWLDGPARLARALLDLAGAPAHEPVDETPLATPQLTQMELAALVGTTRESVNKWLAAFEKQAIVDQHRGVITILQPDALRRRVY